MQDLFTMRYGSESLANAPQIAHKLSPNSFTEGVDNLLINQSLWTCNVISDPAPTWTSPPFCLQ